MPINGATSSPSSPSDLHSIEVPASQKISTVEVPRLHLQGDLIFLDGTERILYRLTQAPVSGSGASLGIQQLIRKINSPESDPDVASRLRLLYEARCPSIGHFSDDGIYSIESQGGRESFSKGAALIRGKYRPFLGRLGTSWKLSVETGSRMVTFLMERKGKDREMTWSKESGEIVATGPLTDGSSKTAYLNFGAELNQREIHLIVMAWCTIIWQANRTKREKENQMKYRQFGMYHSSVIVNCLLIKF
jgi:hypothetical protein